MKDKAAKEIVELLGTLDETLVVAETCTAGMIMATIGGMAGSGGALVGGIVPHMPAAKPEWLTVRGSLENRRAAADMAVAALESAPDAGWALAVTGHLVGGKGGHGRIFIAVARRTRKGRVKIREETKYDCRSENGTSLETHRQREAAEAALTLLARVLHSKVANKSPDKGEDNVRD